MGGPLRIDLTVDDKELKLELGKSTELERLTVLSSVFKLLDVDDSLSNMIDDYVKIGKAYQEFYSQVDNIEPSDREPLNLKLRYEDSEEEVLTTEKEKQPDYYKSGIVEDEGVEKYKCRIHCNCGNNQNIYILPDDKQAECPNCFKKHEVRNAKKQGFPQRDSWGNFFISGGFIGEDEYV